MAKPLARLFDDPAQAVGALEALKAQGYGSETGLLLHDHAQSRRLLEGWLATAVTVDVAGVGPVLVSGPAAAGDGKGAERLAVLLGVPAETFSAYYESGLRRGGVLVVVQAEGERRQAAHGILAAAMASQAPFQDARANSPAFANADRATETNPIDLRMSGDFRKY